MIARRSFLTGLSALIAAPAIVRAESLMKVRAPRIVVPRWEADLIMPYGRSPMMDALSELRELRELWEREIMDAVCFGRPLPSRTILA